MDQTIHSAVNWSEPQDNFTIPYYEQNIKQFWVDTKFTPFADIKVWNTLAPEIQDLYMKVLGGLTLLDTKQGNVGMPRIAEDEEWLVRKTLIMYMAMMEGIHAKSYSTIFTTLTTKDKIRSVFEWVEENKYLQYKAEKVEEYYSAERSPLNDYLRKVTSVLLESFLFYSGFFFPLYLAGQGLLTNSAEIIKLILRDEAIHGSYIGLLAQESYTKLTEEEKQQADRITYELLEDLMDNEMGYTEDLYANVGLDTDVKAFLRYNANKALANIGKEAFYQHEEINPIVQNGISNDTDTFDFFSQQGTYAIAKVAPILDKHFDFDVEDEFIVK